MYRHLITALCVAFALCCPRFAAAQGLDVSTNEPVYFQAEKMGYDSEYGLVLALGNVEVYQGDSILLADRISYDQNTRIVRASGHVSLLQSDGTVYFAEELELADDLKRGVVNEFRIRLADNSLFAAREARRISAAKTELTKAVYSPCKLCKDEEGNVKAPLWQIKADKVNIDQKEQRVVYRDAYFEVYGVPVAYSPYLSHPTPDADRKSGVLLPEYTQSGTLGTVVKVPVYVNIAPDKDATLTPWVTSEEGPVLGGEYRQRTDHGSYQFNGSATYPRDRDEEGVVSGGHTLRGHIFAKGGGLVLPTWNWGFDVNRASDDTYLRRYDIGNQETLISRVFTNHIRGRTYAELEGMAFQGLEREDDPDRIPLVLPALTTSHESRPLWRGSRFRVGGRSFVVSRQVGSENRRVSLETGWRLPHVTPGGQVFEADAALRGDYYSITNQPLPTGQAFDGDETRFIPQLALGWRYPFIKRVGSTSLTVEPIAKAIASSNGNNPDSIPNEDSLNPEFTDLNLFAQNRFAGVDRVENGSRVLYGVQGTSQFAPGRQLHAMLGQNYRLSGDPIFPVSDDASRDLSDVVGRVGVGIEPIDLSYGLRVNASDGGVNRSDVRAGFYTERLNAVLDYIDIQDDPVLADAQQVMAAAALKLTDQWTLNASGQRDLESDQAIRAAGGLTFQNECITLYTLLMREYTRDRDIEPNTSFSVRVALKNLN